MVTHLTPGWVRTSRSKRARPAGPMPSRKIRFPEIPSFRTAMCAVARLASSRPSRKLGQLELVLGVERVPSVIESPNVTRAAALAGASTSTLDSQYQDWEVAASVISEAPVASPV